MLCWYTRHHVWCVLYLRWLIMNLHLFYVVLAGNPLHERHEYMIHVEVVRPVYDMNTQLIMYHVELICESSIDQVR
jgi:hypothetical protein